MAAIINRSRRIESIRAELTAAYKAGRASDETVHTALARYQDTGSPADRDSLAKLFLGLVTMMSIRRKVRGGAPNSELDDLVSDGALAVMNIIEKFAHLPANRFCRMMCGAIRIGFTNGIAERMWAGGKRQKARDNRTMLKIRSIFIKQHGRLPKSVELSAALDLMIQNGQIEKEFTRVTMTPASVADEDGVDLLAQLGADRHGPLYELMNRQTMQIALKGLKGIDRKIFQLAIEGLSVKEISKRVNVNSPTLYKRINGLLWAARCRDDLAAHLGVQPAKSIPTYTSGKPVAIVSVPPAKLAKVA